MTIPEHKRRPTPDRTSPIRNRAVAGRGDAGTPAPQGFSVDGIVNQSVQTALRVVEASNETLRDSVERGVDTAYRVVEEYMLRGRQHARRYNAHDNRENERVNENRQNTNGYSNGPWGPTNPMMASWMQMMRVWAESMNAFIPGGGTMATDWMNQFVPGAASASGFAADARRVVTVHVASTAPASVSVDIDAGAEYARLSVEPLRLSGDTAGTVAPPLSSVSIECVSGELKVSLTVPSGQPAGSYAGVIMDGMGAKRGELRATLAASTSSRKQKKA